MQYRLRPVIACLAAALVAALAGCGDAPEPDAESLATDAGAALEERRTLRFELRAPKSQPPAACDGAVDYEQRRMRMACRSGDGDFELVGVGADVYVRSGGDRWDKLPGGEEAELDFPDPRDVIRALRRGAKSIERVGSEEVGGVDTTRYRVVVDPDLPEIEEALGDDIEATLELWIDDDDLLRRLEASDREAGTFVAEFSAFGKPVEIEPPPAELVDEYDLTGECEGGETAPLRQAQVVEALADVGLDVTAASTGCLTTDGAVALSAVDEDTGVLVCELRRTGDGKAVREEPIDPFLTLELANLSCMLSGDNEAPRAALRQAFTELRRSLG